jgi:hypothetical protein
LYDMINSLWSNQQSSNICSICLRLKNKVKVILRSTSLACYEATNWNPRPIFRSAPWKLTLDCCVFFRLRPLWPEDGYVPYSCSNPTPAQSFWDLSPDGLMTIFHSLNFWDSLNLEGQVLVFISLGAS